MAARPTLAPLQFQSGLQPAAAPVNTYFRPNLSGPELQTITDLSPLSQSLTKLLQRRSEEKKEREVERGRTFAVNNPELARKINTEAGKASTPEERRKILQRTFAGLVAKGTIEEHSSPFFQIGFAESSARATMGEYRDRLNQRLNELTTVVSDEDGLPVEPPSVDDVIAEEFGGVADNAALQNFFGQQVANGLKQNVDLEFRQRVADLRGENISKAHRDNLRNDLAQRFDHLSLKDEVTPEDLEDISTFVTEEIHANSVKEPRRLVFQAARVAAQKASEVSAEDALELLDSVEDLKIGGVAMGEDAVVGLDLGKLQRDYLAQQEREEAEEVRKNDLEVRQAIQEAELDYVGPLLTAQEEGESVYNTYLRIRNRYTEEQPWGKYTPLVLDQLNEYRRGLESQSRTDADTVDGLEIALAEGEDISQDLRAALAAGRLSGSDYRQYLDRNRERQSLVRDVETNPVFNSALGELNSEIQRIQGLSPEAQGDYDEFTSALRQEWKDGYVALVQDTQGDPDAARKRREYLTKTTREFKTQIREREKTILSGRSEFEAEFSGLNARRQDAAPLIDKALQAGTITVDEAAQLRRQNEKATDRSAFFQMRVFRESINAIPQALETSDDPAILNATPVDILDIRDGLEREIEDRAITWLDENLATTEPKDVERKFNTALREIRDEVLQELVPDGVRRRIEAREEPGEAIETEIRLRRDRELSDQLTVNQGNLALESFGVEPSPLLPRSVYETAVDTLNGHDPMFGAPVQKDHSDFKFARAFDELVGQQATDEERKQALVSYRTMMGYTPEEIVSGQASVRLPESAREEAEEELEAQNRLTEHGHNLFTRRAAETRALEILRTQLFEHTVDISDEALKPFSTPMFRSLSEMREWQRQRPEDWRKLLDRLGMKPETQDERDFIKHQISAIQRTTSTP